MIYNAFIMLFLIQKFFMQKIWKVQISNNYKPLESCQPKTSTDNILYYPLGFLNAYFNVSGIMLLTIFLEFLFSKGTKSLKAFLFVAQQTTKSCTDVYFCPMNHTWANSR